MREVDLSIIGFPGYKVQEDGTVWGCRNNAGKLTASWRQLKPEVTKDGYLRVNLRSAIGGLLHKQVHRLILEAFVGSCPLGMEARHYPNNNPSDNRLCNLRWDTHSNNMRDRIFHGTNHAGGRNSNSKMSDGQAQSAIDRINKGEPWETLAKEFGISYHTINNLRKGKTYRNLVRSVGFKKKVLRGSLCLTSKLNESDVLEILKNIDDSVSIAKIASRFKVTSSAIYRIKHGKTWAHLPRTTRIQVSGKAPDESPPEEVAEIRARFLS